MDKQTIAKLKNDLLEEKRQLEDDMSKIGKRDDRNPNDWIPAPPEIDASRADDSEQADVLEEYGENAAILHNLEIRYNNINKALERIENKEYGICSICGKKIEQERLNANPAASTCIAHKDNQENEFFKGS